MTARPFPFNAEPAEPRQAKNTKWKNPLAQDQRVIVHEGDERFAYTVKAGQIGEIPSRHDSVIHRVLCQDDGCRARGGFCTKGHPGMVHGGLAPQLVRAGDDAEPNTLAKGLDTEAEKREAAELAASAAESIRERAEVNAMLAQKRADDLAAKASDKPAKK